MLEMSAYISAVIFQGEKLLFLNPNILCNFFFRSMALLETVSDPEILEDQCTYNNTWIIYTLGHIFSFSHHSLISRPRVHMLHWAIKHYCVRLAWKSGEHLNAWIIGAIDCNGMSIVKACVGYFPMRIINKGADTLSCQCSCQVHTPTLHINTLYEILSKESVCPLLALEIHSIYVYLIITYMLMLQKLARKRGTPLKNYARKTLLMSSESLFCSTSQQWSQNALQSSLCYSQVTCGIPVS